MMKSIFLALILTFSVEPMQTIPTEKIISGEVIEFCNGLSLDFGEHPGLLIIKESSSNTVYNVILNPYYHYRYEKGQQVSIKVKPVENLNLDLQPMCKSVGYLFVNFIEK